MMTKQEMIEGFSEGNTLIQQLDGNTTDNELNLVDECIKENLCTSTPWFKNRRTGRICREMTGIRKGIN